MTGGIKDARLFRQKFLKDVARTKSTKFPVPTGPSDSMKTTTSIAFVVVTIALTSCATSGSRHAFHNTDNSALVVESLDGKTGQMLGPVVSAREDNGTVLAKAMALPQHQTAVVILENYTEPSLGWQFRDRGTPWFIGLRSLGYEHIVFLQGRGVADPEGLLTLVKYD
jgi:hypothetical protein